MGDPDEWVPHAHLICVRHCRSPVEEAGALALVGAKQQNIRVTFKMESRRIWCWLTKYRCMGPSHNGLVTVQRLRLSFGEVGHEQQRGSDVDRRKAQ